MRLLAPLRKCIDQDPGSNNEIRHTHAVLDARAAPATGDVTESSDRGGRRGCPRGLEVIEGFLSIWRSMTSSIVNFPSPRHASEKSPSPVRVESWDDGTTCLVVRREAKDTILCAMEMVAPHTIQAGAPIVTASATDDDFVVLRLHHRFSVAETQAILDIVLGQLPVPRGPASADAGIEAPVDLGHRGRRRSRR